MFCREILNSNPEERLDDYAFILSITAVRINGVPFSLALSETRVANHALVFSIRALSKFRVVFVCKAFLALYFSPPQRSLSCCCAALSSHREPLRRRETLYVVMAFSFMSLFRAFSWFVPYVNKIEINK